MLDLGLSGAERKAFHNALRNSHLARTRFQVLDRDENVIETVTNRVISGQVDVSAKSSPTRVLQLSFVDTGGRFHFVPSGAGSAALFADNFIRVRRDIYVEALGDWVQCPVFTGPITACDRNGHVVNVTAVGKESLALQPVVTWEPAGPFGKRTKVTDAIRAVMRAQGERSFDLPDLPARLKRPLSLSKSSQAWRVVRRLADDVDRQVFYDGRGRLRLRKVPNRTLWVFTDGPSGNIDTAALPTFSFDMAEARNTIEVLGPEPEGKEPRPRVVVTAPPSDPLSPWRLARNGHPRYLVETIETGATRREIMQARGQRELDTRLRAAVNVSFGALPVPHLEPMDEVALVLDGERTVFALQEYSIPLVAGTMSVGYHRRVRTRGRSRR